MMNRNLAASSGRFHAVKFYESPDALCRLVARFLGEGFLATQPAMVIATPAHCAGIERELHGRGFDVERLKEQRDLLMLDADDVLRRLMVDGTPSPDRFRAAIVPTITEAGRNRKQCVIRAYGEMVNVLWQRGETGAAIKLELLWNELAGTHYFSLLCGYAMGNFYKDAAVGDICGHHTHVLSDAGEADAVQ